MRQRSSRLMRRLRRISQFTAAQWGALVVAAPLVAVIRIGLWILPGSAVVRFVGRMRRRSRSTSSLPITRTSTVIWAVEVVARRIPHATCLTQAIAAKLLLDFLGDH